MLYLMRRFLIKQLIFQTGIGCLFLAPVAGAEKAAEKAVDNARPTFFVGRIKYSKNDGDDCSGVGKDLIQLVSKNLTVCVQEEKRIRLTDKDLYKTPFLFMNGHHNFVLSEQEIKNLNEYFSRGGFFLASGCCTNPEFPIAWRREFGRIFPNEKVKNIPYEHPIYRSFYNLGKILTLHTRKEICLEALFLREVPVAVLCEEGLCCSLAMKNNCNSGKGISPKDGKEIATNIVVYSLTH